MYTAFADKAGRRGLRRRQPRPKSGRSTAVGLKVAERNRV